MSHTCIQAIDDWLFGWDRHSGRNGHIAPAHREGQKSLLNIMHIIGVTQERRRGVRAAADLHAFSSQTPTSRCRSAAAGRQ
jgi:hypothetical protein